MNDFERDNEWQVGVRDSVLAPFYRDSCDGGRYVFIDKSRCSCLLQKRLAVDTVLQSKRGGSVCVEEKMTRFPRNGVPLVNFFLETMSCTKPGREKEGWMQYAEADYLLYGFQLTPETMDFEAWLIPFHELKTWFWMRADGFRLFVMPNTINRTAGRLVPIALVQRIFHPKQMRLRSDELRRAT